MAKDQDTPKIIANKIKELGEKLVNEIKKEQDPAFITSQRGKSNVFFDEDAKVIQLGEKTTERNFLNVGHARKFMQTSVVMKKTHDYLQENKTAAIREIYYELKHTLKKGKENTFEDQTESDSVIVDLEHAINSIREKLNLHANPKGTLYGDITLVDVVHDGDTFNASKLGRGGWSIMSRMEPEEIKFKKVDAKYLLVIETSAMFERLIEERFPQKNECLLVGTGGQAARGTRRLIARLHREEKLPVYVFSVDGEENVVIEENGLIKNAQLKDLMQDKEIFKIDYPFENERASINAKSLTFNDKESKFESINQIIRHPITEELFEVMTETGFSVKATKSHSIIVYDSKANKFAEKKPEEINLETDYAIISLDIPNNESLTRIDLSEFIKHQNLILKENKIINKKSKTEFPRFIEKENLNEFCRLLGYYAAEGHIDSAGVCFSFNSNETKFIKDIELLAEKLFESNTSKNNPHETETQIRINNVLIAKLFEELGRKGANSKQVPFIAFNVPSKAKKEFLKGYFRGDGRVDFKKEKSSVELWAKTVSKKLAYDLVLLINQIGGMASIQYPKENFTEHEVEMKTNSGTVIAKIKGKQKTYLVSVANKKSLNILKEIVAELNPESVPQIEGSYIKTPKLDSLPRAFVNHYREEFRKQFKSLLEENLPTAVFQWPRISKQKLRKLFSLKETGKELELIKKLANSKTTLVKIKEVKKVEAKDNFVYDIEMNNTHRFFANNICVHNTDGDPYGWYIYSVIKQGSMALAAHSEMMSVPEAKYIGMTLDDVETYKLKNVTEKMKDGDIKRAKEMLDYDWFKNKEWQRQLKKAIDEKIRIEQQALANRSLSFVADTYLPEKIKKKDFLP